MAAVDDYLEELDQGTFDSHGTFTIDVARAREKLAQFQLRSAEQRALKLLQGLVLLRGQRIWVSQTNKGLTLVVEAPREELQLNELREALESAQFKQESTPHRHLAMGLCAFLAQGDPTVFWATFDDEGGAHLERLYGPPEVAKLKIPRGATRPNSVCLHIQGHDLGTVGGMEFRKRCAFAPVPVFLNGTVVQKPLWQPAPAYWRGGEIYVDGYRLDEACAERIAMTLPGPSRQLVGDWPPQLSQQRPAAGGRVPVTTGLRYFEGVDTAVAPVSFANPKPGLLGGLFSLSWDSAQVTHQFFLGDDRLESWIWPVVAGVMLDPVPCSLPVPGLQVVLAAPALRTDLSQFRVIADENWLEMERSLIGPLLHLLETATQASGKITPEKKFDGPWAWLGLTGMFCLPQAASHLLGAGDWLTAMFWVAGSVLPFTGFRADQRLEAWRFNWQCRERWQGAAVELGKMQS